MERRDDSGCVEGCQTLVVGGKRCKGKRKRSWRECVAEDMRILGLKEKDTKDWVELRRGIWGTV